MRIVSLNAWGGAMFDALAAWLPATCKGSPPQALHPAQVASFDHESFQPPDPDKFLQSELKI